MLKYYSKNDFQEIRHIENISKESLFFIYIWRLHININ